MHHVKEASWPPIVYQWSSQQDATSQHGGVQDATKEQCIRIPTGGRGGK